jgi:hypothetical protein
VRKPERQRAQRQALELLPAPELEQVLEQA